MRVVVIGAGMAGLVAAADAARRVRRRASTSSSSTRVVRPAGGWRPAGSGTRRSITARSSSPCARRRSSGGSTTGWIAGWSRSGTTGSTRDDGHPALRRSGRHDIAGEGPRRRTAVECSTMAFTLRRSNRGPDPLGRGDRRRHDAAGGPRDHHDAAGPGVRTARRRRPRTRRGDVPRRLRPDDLPARRARPARRSCRPAAATQPADEVFSFIGDNMSKGVSAVPAITFHANPTWSEAHWDDPVDVLGHALIDAARPWLGDAVVVEHQVKKWRFATPRTISPDPCLDARRRVDRARRRCVRRPTDRGCPQLRPRRRPHHLR